MRYRVCTEDGCPVMVTGGHSRCDDCRRAYERKRGSKAERGYDAEFQREKRKLKATNPTHCEHCGYPFTEQRLMQAGHAVAVRHGGSAEDGLKPHCVPCNAAWRRTGL